jgi:hypothetical protein
VLLMHGAIDDVVVGDPSQYFIQREDMCELVVYSADSGM